MKVNDFPDYLSRFFSSFLQAQKGLAANTVQSYADAFLLLFQYFASLGIPEKEISFSTITRQNIEGFLDWLESERENKAATRNQRLAAIHSFCKYTILKNPKYYKTCTDLLSIPMKKRVQKQSIT
jgi:site-specific recombinase XerD